MSFAAKKKKKEKDGEKEKHGTRSSEKVDLEFLIFFMQYVTRCLQYTQPPASHKIQAINGLTWACAFGFK